MRPYIRILLVGAQCLRPKIRDFPNCTTRESLGLTQEQVIAQLKHRYGVHLSQQALSALENGKRKIDAETELPALAALYGKPIHYFYESWELNSTPKTPMPLNLHALNPREKLLLAAEMLDRLLRD